MQTLDAAYTFRRLANMTGMSWWAVRRLVRAKRIRTVKVEGSMERVPLVAFRDALPDVWASMLERQQLRHDTAIECSQCGSVVG